MDDWRSGTRPTLLVFSHLVFLGVSLAVGYGFSGQTAPMALGIAAAGTALLSPPWLAIRTRRAFRVVVGVYAVLVFLSSLSVGIVFVPSLLLLVLAAIASPAYPGWRMGYWFTAFTVACVALFFIGLGTLALIR